MNVHRGFGRAGVPLHRLRSLGLTQPVLSCVPFDALDCLGRVVFESHTHCVVATEDGDVSARLHPRLHDPAHRVVTGDWVRLDRSGDPTWIVERLERARALTRRDPERGVQVMCANIDLALIATAMDRDLNRRRLDRYRAVCAEAGVPAALILTKIDLDPERVAAVAAELGDGFDLVFPVSAVRGEGIDAVRRAVPYGTTAALLGSSGVGKTTLVNALAGTALDTGEIRAADSRGRHTTTARRLLPLPGGGWLVDNPGIRSVGPTSAEAVDEVFADVAALAAHCRFRDCAHVSEPGCAIVAALDDGSLSRPRYEAWQKLLRELAYEERRADPDAERAERSRWKKIHRAQRQRDDLRRRFED